MVLTSLDRPASDKAWNYLRPLPHALPFVQMRNLGNGSFELIVLDGHKGKTVSNSNDPPGSFHTKDVFEPHHRMEHAWKYLGRLDDCITLVTGKKIFPVGFEDTIRQHDLVQEAVVFGAERMLPGILISRRPAADSMPEQSFLDSVWPLIIHANSASDFSIRDKDLLVSLPSDTVFPVTEKGSIFRLAFYSGFSGVIDAAYARREENWKPNSDFSEDSTQEWLVRIVRSTFALDGIDLHTNLFDSGMDSVCAVQLQKLIERSFKSQPSSRSLGLKDLYDCGTCANIASKLHSIHSVDSDAQNETLEEMIEIIQQCKFPACCRTSLGPKAEDAARQGMTMVR